MSLNFLVGQVKLNRADLKDSGKLYALERNPDLLQVVEFDVDVVLDSLPLLYRYFVDCVLEMQQDDYFLEEKIAEKLLFLETSTACFDGDQTAKIYCAERLKSQKDVILSYLIFQFFELELKDKYCHYNYYKEISVWEDFCGYGKEIGYQFCASDNISIRSHLWTDPYHILLPAFIRFECPILVSQKREFNRFFQGIISNEVVDVEESEIIQRYASRFIYQKLQETNSFKTARKEIVAFLKDFKRNAKPDEENHKFYSFKGSVSGINVFLGNTWLSSRDWTEEQKKRFKVGQPIKTKHEIVKEFKSTQYYKVFKKGKLVKAKTFISR